METAPLGVPSDILRNMLLLAILLWYLYVCQPLSRTAFDCRTNLLRERLLVSHEGVLSLHFASQYFAEVLENDKVAIANRHDCTGLLEYIFCDCQAYVRGASRIDWQAHVCRALQIV